MGRYRCIHGEQVLISLSLPADDPSVDWSHTTLRYGDREESRAKLSALGLMFRGQILRWRKTEWRQGLYGDPADPKTQSTSTGWIVKKYSLPQPAVQLQTDSAQSMTVCYPPLPRLMGDDSFLNHEDELIADLGKRAADPIPAVQARK